MPMVDRTERPAHIRPGRGLKGERMKLPNWVEKEVNLLPAEFTGQIVVECWSGGVTRMDTKTCRTTPKAGEIRRDDRK